MKLYASELSVFVLIIIHGYIELNAFANLWGKRNMNMGLEDMAQEQWKTCIILIQVKAKWYNCFRISEVTLEIMALNIFFP